MLGAGTFGGLPRLRLRLTWLSSARAPGTEASRLSSSSSTVSANLGGTLACTWTTYRALSAPVAAVPSTALWPRPLAPCTHFPSLSFVTLCTPLADERTCSVRVHKASFSDVRSRILCKMPVPMSQGGFPRPENLMISGSSDPCSYMNVAMASRPHERVPTAESRRR